MVGNISYVQNCGFSFTITRLLRLSNCTKTLAIKIGKLEQKTIINSLYRPPFCYSINKLTRVHTTPATAINANV